MPTAEPTTPTPEEAEDDDDDDGEEEDEDEEDEEEDGETLSATAEGGGNDTSKDAAHSSVLSHRHSTPSTSTRRLTPLALTPPRPLKELRR